MQTPVTRLKKAVALNAVTRKDAYSLPTIYDVSDQLHGMRFFSTLDLPSAFFLSKFTQSLLRRRQLQPILATMNFSACPLAFATPPKPFKGQ